LKFRTLYIVLLWWNDLTIYINDNADEAVHRHDINKLYWDWKMLNIYMNSSDIELDECSNNDIKKRSKMHNVYKYR